MVTVSAPVVVLSASVIEGDRQRCAQLGADAFFVKPTGLDGLVALARELKSSWLTPAATEQS